MRLGALIDTYYHKRFIEQAINGVLEQDFPAPGAEVILVCHGSTMAPRTLCDGLRRRSGWSQKEMAVQASAFNEGFAECRGAVIVAVGSIPDGTDDLPRAARRRSGKKQNFSYDFHDAGTGASAALFFCGRQWLGRKAGTNERTRKQCRCRDSPKLFSRR